MKEKILLGALAQFILAAILVIVTVLFQSFETINDVELPAKVYLISTILGITGIGTLVIGALFPKGSK